MEINKIPKLWLELNEAYKVFILLKEETYKAIRRIIKKIKNNI